MARRIDDLRADLEREPYNFDRRFLFHVSVDGPFAIRGVHRRARSEYANQRRLRQHYAGRVVGQRLDRRGPLPAGDHRLGGRHHHRPSDRVVRRGLPGQRRGGHRRYRGGSGHAVRPAAARPDHGNGRRGPGNRKRRSRARTRHPAHLRSVERGDGQQRISRHPPGCRAHPRRDGRFSCASRKAQRIPARGGGFAHGVRFARDLYAGARRQRRSRDLRVARSVRQRGGPHRDRQYQGPDGSRHGRRHRRCGGGEGARNRVRAAGAEFQRGRSRAGQAESFDGRRLSGRVCAASGRGIRFADQYDAVALDSAPRRRAHQSARAGLCHAHRGYECVECVVEPDTPAFPRRSWKWSNARCA